MTAYYRAATAMPLQDAWSRFKGAHYRGELGYIPANAPEIRNQWLETARQIWLELLRSYARSRGETHWPITEGETIELEDILGWNSAQMWTALEGASAARRPVRGAMMTMCESCLTPVKRPGTGPPNAQRKVGKQGHQDNSRTVQEPKRAPSQVTDSGADKADHKVSFKFLTASIIPIAILKPFYTPEDEASPDLRSVRDFAFHLAQEKIREFYLAAIDYSQQFQNHLRRLKDPEAVKEASKKFKEWHNKQADKLYAEWTTSVNASLKNPGGYESDGPRVNSGSDEEIPNRTTSQEDSLYTFSGARRQKVDGLSMIDILRRQSQVAPGPDHPTPAPAALPPPRLRRQRQGPYFYLRHFAVKPYEIINSNGALRLSNKGRTNVKALLHPPTPPPTPPPLNEEGSALVTDVDPTLGLEYTPVEAPSASPRKESRLEPPRTMAQDEILDLDEQGSSISPILREIELAYESAVQERRYHEELNNLLRTPTPPRNLTLSPPAVAAPSQSKTDEYAERLSLAEQGGVEGWLGSDFVRRPQEAYSLNPYNSDSESSISSESDLDTYFSPEIPSVSNEGRRPVNGRASRMAHYPPVAIPVPASLATPQLQSYSPRRGALRASSQQRTPSRGEGGGISERDQHKHIAGGGTAFLNTHGGVGLRVYTRIS
ncbi:unnamed protein product [Cyclocybe aegerita]|uniref:Uncharacterized protein n=1 Tax=Cyclocybe aegerita TaxID=1973307 RepID=A0A8S0XY67_CYCAE|nr:unnamed protein product [Cyclocybe aegerita]